MSALVKNRTINRLSDKQDRELVALLKNGSQEAFGELYIRYKDKVTGFCKRTLRDKSEAEDMVHDIFLQILETCDSLNPELSFYGYLQTIAQNRIIDDFKKFEVHMRYVMYAAMPGNEVTDQTENQIIYDDYVKLLNELIEGLSPKQKEVFRLSRIEGLSYKEIAKRLNISVPTVQEHASLAQKKIKEQLMKHTDINFQKVIIFLILFS